jgi:hypothetical protein
MSDSPNSEPLAGADSPVTLTAKLLEFGWPSVAGISLSDMRTFGCGIGAQYVYCYTFQNYIELARLKKESKFRIKVGKADTDPIKRILQQVAGSNTAVAERPHVLLVFQTLAAGHLERWLHARLSRAADSIGSEWFITNPDELIELYSTYLCDASRGPAAFSKATTLEVGITRAHDQSETSAKASTTGGNQYYAQLGPAKEVVDVVCFVRKCPSRKDRAVLTSENKRQGYHIHDVIEELGRCSIEQLCQTTGYRLTRVLAHVNWAIKNGHIRMG